MFTCLFCTQDNSENVSQDQVIRTEARQDFEPEIDPNEVPFYKVLLLLFFAFFFCFVLLSFGGVFVCVCVVFFSTLGQFHYPVDRYKVNQFCSVGLIISYPTSASGIIVLLKTPAKYREFFPTVFVKTTDFQLVFNFEQTRTVTIFGNG